jgi:hypothetical protein
MSVIAITVFSSFLLALVLRLIELQSNFLRAHRVLSAVSLFKLAMVSAMVCIRLVLHSTRLQFNREWFFRLCGLTLDMIVIASLSSAHIHGLNGDSHVSSQILVILVAACVTWNLVCFWVILKTMFPNFWYERGVALIADALGHSFMGLLMVRTCDPNLRTPVPLAYAYKLLLSIIPGTESKNMIVISLLAAHGEWWTSGFCILVVATWLYIFDRFFREKVTAATNSPLRKRPSQLKLDGEAKGSISMVDVKSNAVRSADSSLQPFPLQLGDRSSILTSTQMSQLGRVLPITEAMRTWVLKYSMLRDGASLSTLMHCLSGHDHALLSPKQEPALSLSTRLSYTSAVLIIEDTHSYVFGGYVNAHMHCRVLTVNRRFVSQPLKNSFQYYGDGTCFVFRFAPSFEVFRWTGKNTFCVLSNDKHLAMGSGQGFAFSLDDELFTGVSQCSETFDNPQLASTEFFNCLNVEVWAFENHKYSI